MFYMYEIYFWNSMKDTWEYAHTKLDPSIATDYILSYLRKGISAKIVAVKDGC